MKSLVHTEYPSGSTVEYQCQQLYKHQGNLTIVCENGSWSDVPVCLEPCTVSQKDMTKNNIQLRWKTDNKLYSEHDNTVEFICSPGFEIQPSSTLRVKCNRGKLMYPRCFKQGSCILSKKVMLINYIVLPDTHLEIEDGESMQFQCIKGMIPEQELRVTCSKGEINYPKCNKQNEHKCENPPSIRFGQIEPTSNRSNVKYRCDNGYQLSGPEESICIGGNWSLPPICLKTEKKCPAPPRIIYGEMKSLVHTEYPSGSTVEYQCQQLYKHQGNLTIVCENGSWSDVPVCLEPCTVSQKDMTKNNIQLRWKTDNKLYSEHDNTVEFICSPGFEIQPSSTLRVKCNRGKLMYPRCFKQGSCILSKKVMLINYIVLPDTHLEIEDGESMQFQCIKGMIPEQELRVTCSKGEINYPKCNKQKPCRLSLEEINKNNLIMRVAITKDSMYDHGVKIPLRCKPGFFTVSVLSLECYNGVMRYPTCFNERPCRLNQEYLDRNHLELDPVNDDKVYYNNGEKIEFLCKPGYKSISDVTGLCIKEDIIYPFCYESGD
ncbi:coagulation factor XIII B chain-like [Pelobates fuscus]|uniref:coagulation factor XIII B chain-like n=1 Tax=Pelobates fuscus TaxID=191477 RepID=UPI002FE4AB4C